MSVRGGPNEPEAVKLRVCRGKLVGERVSHVEDRAGVARRIEILRRLVCPTEHASDQLVHRVRVFPQQRVAREVTQGFAGLLVDR